jgi:hypothetical protein
MSPTDAASIVLNLLAFIGGAAFLLFNSSHRRGGPVGTRLSLALALLMVLIGVRAVRWAFGWDDLQNLEEACAAMVPLAALIVAEGLQRRHAPTWMKAIGFYGGILFVILAVLRPNGADPHFAAALGLFVCVSLAGVATMLFLRRRATLSTPENNAISALGLGLVTALPFQASDFLYAAGLSPLRAGGLGLLLFVFSAARLSATGAGASVLLVDMGWALIGAGAAFLTFVAALGPPSLMIGMAWYLIIFGLVCVILIVQGLRERDLSQRRNGMLQALADAPITDAQSFVEHIFLAPEWRRSIVLDAAALNDYNHAQLRAHFSERPIAHVRDLKSSGSMADPLAILLDSHEATHAFMLTSNPISLMLVTLPAHATGPEAELTLRLAQKLARAADGCAQGRG